MNLLVTLGSLRHRLHPPVRPSVFPRGQSDKKMIGDNVVLRPPRLSQDSTPITFAVRVAQLMRWVSKTEVHTHRTHTI